MIRQYSIENDHIRISALNMGCILREFYIKETGEDIILSYDDYQSYVKDSAYLGYGLVGPFAGRIENGTYQIKGRWFQANRNFMGQHCLHGGDYSLNNLIYQGEVLDDRIVFAQKSKAPQGFSGNLSLKVTYQLQGNQLIQDIWATSDEDCLFNPTNHSYFHLGEKDIRKLKMNISSDYMYTLSSSLIPGKKSATDNSPFKKLNHLEPLGEIDQDHPEFKATGFIDHPFHVTGPAHILSKKYAMTLRSNQKWLVIYSGNWMDQMKGTIQGQKPYKHQGICFEYQNLPNGVNRGEEDDTSILDKGEEYHWQTSWEIKIL